MIYRLLTLGAALMLAHVAVAETQPTQAVTDDAKLTAQQKANRSACLRLGVTPNAPEMAACMNADSRSERIRIADRSVDGTN